MHYPAAMHDPHQPSTLLLAFLRVQPAAQDVNRFRQVDICQSDCYSEN